MSEEARLKQIDKMMESLESARKDSRVKIIMVYTAPKGPGFRKTLGTTPIEALAMMDLFKDELGDNAASELCRNFHSECGAEGREHRNENESDDDPMKSFRGMLKMLGELSKSDK